MCGIAGIIRKAGPVAAEELRGMANTLIHRGPDDVGYYLNGGVGLCHRRLSIIDLSAAGHQPMPNEDGSIVVVFNGEIYNYRELAVELTRKGHVFRGHSDTEVIVHGYEEWGDSCVDRFNGMFSFAIWDANKRRLFAARDRLGIKPFYYLYSNGEFAFASEIKALRTLSMFSRRPDEYAVRQYLVHGHPIDDRTWHRDVKQLLPGHCVDVTDGNAKISSYWDVPLCEDIDRPTNYGERCDELRQLVQDAVKLHLRSDVPVGSHLSGGLDSSILVSLSSAQLGRGIHTFSAAYKEGAEFDERPFIDIVAKRFGTIHNVVTPTWRDFEALLPKVIDYMDEPCVGPAVLPMYRVAECAAKFGIKVVSGGQGADEAFGGYPPFYALHAREILMGLRSGACPAPIGELWRLPEYLWKGGVVTRAVRKGRKPVKLLRGAHAELESSVEWLSQMNRASREKSPFQSRCYEMIKQYLRGLLHPEDRMSMAWSIESRVPLLDYRIIEFAARTPPWMKIRRGYTKAILRDSMRGLVPNEILDRRDKKGYPVPIREWFAGPLREYLAAVLRRSSLASGHLVDGSILSNILDEHFSGTHDHSGHIWRALNTELWFQKYA